MPAKTMRFLDLDCIELENDCLQLVVAQSIGPRILSLRFQKGENLFAELPDLVTRRPDGKEYHFYGGHRLWLAPEDPICSYGLDDDPVEFSWLDGNLLLRKPVEEENSIEKSILIHLEPKGAKLTLTHGLTNRGAESLECAPWAITQLKTGGVAILPQANSNSGLLPNRFLAFWPYTDISSTQIIFGNDVLCLSADRNKPFKIGFPNPRGWLAYWQKNILFIKKAPYNLQARYSDFGCSSECYCCRDFLDLETLGPVARIEAGESVFHTETWEIYPDIPLPRNEGDAMAIANKIGLD
jgi:hypothetical protein